MSTTPAKLLDGEGSQSRPVSGETAGARMVITWSSFFFALLQSICTFFAAVDGVRLAIGLGSLAVGAVFGAAVRQFHADWIREPMIALALLGSLLNLAILFQVRRLRRRPASQWRMQPLSPRKLRMERWQMVLSIATLILIGVEEYLHLHWHGHL
jgi:hypothetical protein